MFANFKVLCKLELLAITLPFFLPPKNPKTLPPINALPDHDTMLNRAIKTTSLKGKMGLGMLPSKTFSVTL